MTTFISLKQGKLNMIYINCEYILEAQVLFIILQDSR